MDIIEDLGLRRKWEKKGERERRKREGIKN